MPKTAESKAEPDLVAVFKDTQTKSSMSKSSLNSTVVFDKKEDDLSIIQPVSYPEPTVEVLNIDSFEAAKKMKAGQEEDATPPLVLNLANRFWVGGGVTIGAKAQEEDLMRRSDYYMALSQDKFTKPATKENAGRLKYKTPIPEVGSMYTPSVSVFKSPDYQDIQPFEVACLAVAGYDLGREDTDRANDRKLFLDNKGNFDIKLFEEGTKKKIRHMLDVALFKGHTTLVLGALSCGAFQLRDQPGVTAIAVANAYKAVLLEPEYKNKFKHIVFAVLDKNPNPTSNFTIFQQTLSGLSAQLKSEPPTSTPKPAPNPVPSHFATTVPIGTEPEDDITSPPRTFTTAKTDLSPTVVGKGTNMSIDKVHNYALLHKDDFSSINLEKNEWHGTLINNQQIHAKQESNGNEVQFSIQQNLFDGKDLTAFKETVTKLCDMAVWSAGEGTEFKISQKLKDKANDASLSKDERDSYKQKVDIMEKAFDAAIETRAKNRAVTGQPPEENPPYREGKAPVTRIISTQKPD